MKTTLVKGILTTFCVGAFFAVGYRPTNAEAQNGWPQRAGTQVVASPLVVDLDLDGKMEVIVACVQDLNGEPGGGVCVWDNEGIPFGNWPADDLSSHQFYASPAAANMDADPALELILAMSGKFHDGVSASKGFIYDCTGICIKQGSIGSQNGILATPAIGHLSNPNEMQIVLNILPEGVQVRNANLTKDNSYGALSLGDDLDALGMMLMSSCTLADLNDSGVPEILVGSAGSFWCIDDVATARSVSMNNWILSSPAVANLGMATSPYCSIIAGGGDGKLHHWVTGTSCVTPSQWQHFTYQTEGVIYSSPAIAEVNGDNTAMEFVFASYDGKVYVTDQNLNDLPGWPKSTRGPVFASPAIGDLDGDGYAEVVVCGLDGRVYIWNHDGTPLPGWPKTVDSPFYSSPAIGDLDGDGMMSVIAVSFNGWVYEWELSYNTIGSEYTGGWPMFRRDAQRTGCVPR